MILKKPYAFLIRNFKLIHLVITFIMGYLVIKNRQVYKFLVNCIKNTSLKYNALSYINNSIFIYIGILIVLTLVIYYLLKHKDKPRKIYIVSIIGYLAVGIFMFVIYSYFTSIVNNVIEQKTIRLYRDLFTITLYFQYLMIIIMGIRGLGFDIKKFNFSQDASELNISSEDNEEVIVDLNLNTTDAMRYVRKQKRELGYFFKEYKIYIIIIFIILLVIFGFKGYGIYKEKYMTYDEGVMVGGYYHITVVDSYYDLNNNNVIIKFNAFKSGTKEKLNIDNMILLMGDNKYYPDKTICSKYKDIASCYKQQLITKTSGDYILTYHTDNITVKKVYLLYKEGYEKDYKIKLDMKSY